MKKRMEFSKKICIFSLVLFAVTTLIALGGGLAGLGIEALPYVLPATGTIATASVSFYYNKAKAENLARQQLRNIILEEYIKKTLTKEEGEEALQKIGDISSTIDEKLDVLYQDSVVQNIDTNNKEL